jgi:hypothetical protein
LNILLKFKETAISVVPIMAIVVLLGLTVAPLESVMLWRFVIGGIMLILGLTIFLLGVDLGIQPMGEHCGAELTKKRSLPLLTIVAFVIGFLVTAAEPDIQVFGDQVNNVFSSVNKTAFVFVIAGGVGIFIMIGLLRSVLNFSIKIVLLIAYVLLFVLAFCSPTEFIGVAFDSGGATTGPMTVPFILALGLGVSSVRAATDKEGFGLTGVTSIGPICAVLVYSLFLQKTGRLDAFVCLTDVVAEGTHHADGIFALFSVEFLSVIKEAFLSLLPLVGLFIVFQITLLKLTTRQVIRICIGFVYSFIGLTIFLLGVNGGFMQAGEALGQILGQKAFTLGGKWLLLLICTGLLIGAIVVCAEPAVWVLTEQVELISGGSIKRKILLSFLAVGAAIAIGLALWRAIAGFNLKYILVPGYAIALLLMIFSPDLFTGIAFDSGGVASGPITSTFVLSFTLGAAGSGSGCTDVFGVIALVAMMPLISIQLLGIIYNMKSRKSAKAVEKGGE